MHKTTLICLQDAGVANRGPAPKLQGENGAILPFVCLRCESGAVAPSVDKGLADAATFMFLFPT